MAKIMRLSCKQIFRRKHRITICNFYFDHNSICHFVLKLITSMHIPVEEDRRSTELVFLLIVFGCTAVAMALTVLLQERMDRPQEFISNFILADLWFAIMYLYRFISAHGSSFTAIFPKHVYIYLLMNLYLV